MGVIFVLIGGFCISLLLIWRCCSAFFIRSEHTWTFLVSFTVLARLVLDPFVGLFKSKNTFCDSLF